MTLNRFLFALLFAFTGSAAFAQGAFCSEADPFCTDEGDAFPASTSTTAEGGPDYECLGQQPNPAWYYLQIATAGNLTIELTNSANVDIDFICWGPYSTLTGACSLLTSDAQTTGCGGGALGTYPCGNVVDCSFETDATEFVDVTSAAVGQYYILLITNFSGEPTDIFAEQISGNGATDCTIVTPCDLNNLTAIPGTCIANDTYTVSGSFTFVNAPAAGTLTVVANTGSGIFTQTFNPPFTNDSTYNYSIPNIPGDGSSCTVTAGFTSDPGCMMSVPYTAPLCVGPCDILTLTATPGPCTINLTYSATGSFTYDNAPATGTLTVVVNNGSGTFTQTFNPPFTNGATYNYNIPNIPGDGANTTVTVGFTADAACNMSATYTAPVCVPPCDITTLTATPGECNPDTSFDLAGTFSYNLAPATGTLDVIVNTPAGQFTQSFNPPFTDGQVYNYSFPNLPANQTSATVTVRFSDDIGCQMTVPFTTPTCICETNASFNVNPATMTLEGTHAQMINSSTNDVSWQWFFGDGDSSNLENPAHLFPSDNPGNYTIELITTSEFGCTDTARMTVVVKEDVLFFVPNAFTPGNDEFNNTFQPVFTSGFDAHNYELLIYNRWGETIFESHDATVGWDGTYQTKPLGEGIYTWVIRFKTKEDDSRKEVQGHVYLLR